MTSVTLQLTDEQIAKINKLLETRPNQTFVSLCDSIFAQGLAQRVYRTQRNAEQYQALKAWKAANK